MSYVAGSFFGIGFANTRYPAPKIFLVIGETHGLDIYQTYFVLNLSHRMHNQVLNTENHFVINTSNIEQRQLQTAEDLDQL